jgi:hypothetical protein
MKVFLLGGLGNQLFQTSLAIGLASNCNMPVILDGSSVQGYEIRANLLSLPDTVNVHSSFSKGRNFHRFASRGLIPMVFNEQAAEKRICRGWNFKSYHGFYGYFQSMHYFEGLEKSIEAMFKNVDSYPTYQERSKDISIHIRGGDYLTNSKYISLAPEYYSNALKMIQNLGDFKSIIYSNDISYAKWVMGKVTRNSDVKFEYAFARSGESELFDLVKMASSAHVIIANSTFSWWSAWLASRMQSKIYRPKNYYHNSQSKSSFYPGDWISVNG